MHDPPSSSPTASEHVVSDHVASRYVVNTHPMIVRSKTGIFKPKAFSVTKHHLPSLADFVPSTYLQAFMYSQ